MDEDLPVPSEGASSEVSIRPKRRRLSGNGASGEAHQRLAAALLAAAVGGSVLAIGALHLPVLLVISALSFAAAATALRRQALGPSGLVVPLPSLVFLVLAAYTLLQAIPLPIRWLEVVAPTVADIWERCLLPFGEHGPRWASLSVDPGASTVEALKWATYAAVFAAASTVSARHGASWGVGIVFGAAMAAALATLGHGLAGATAVYGLYKPTFPAVSWHLGPLLNSNNLAGYLNLGALCGLGLMLADRAHLPRWFVGVGVALIVGVEVTAASRGGVGALLVGTVTLALFMRRDADRRRASGASTLMILGAVAAGALLAVLGGTDNIWSELYDKDLSKLSMVVWAKPLLRDHAFFGVGRGAFESVFPLYRTVPGNLVYTHAENFVIQWLAEWGIPVGLAALAFFAWAFAPRRLGALRSTVAAGAWCGVGALLLQNLVDLGLEVPAVSIAAATVLGSLWGDRHRARRREALRRPGPFSPASANVLAGASASICAAVGLVAVACGAHDIDSDRRAVRDAFAAPDAARPLLHEAMLRHPAEPYFPLVGAMLAFHGGTESPIPWLQRSLERAQINGRAHLLLAEVLAGRGSTKQALFELRLAAEDDTGVTDAAATYAARWTKAFDDLLIAVPAGKPGSRVLSILGGLLRAGKASPAEIETARRCDREAIQRDPTVIEPRVREAMDRIEALTGGSTTRLASAGLCVDRAGCRAQILEDADAIAATASSSSVPAMLRARLLVAEGKPVEAVKLLEGACDLVADRTACQRERVIVAAGIKDPAPIDAAAKAMLGVACGSSGECADTATWIAGIRRERGETGTAIALLARAAREEPGNEKRWLALADAAAQAGAHGQALEALEKVAKHRGGADPALKQRIDAERTQVLGGLMAPPR